MKILPLILTLISLPVFAQEQQGTSLADIQKTINDTLASKWYERIQLRGYAHLRYNKVLETNEKYDCSVCDKSIGKNEGFFLRRARLTFYGDVSDRMFIYIQPDYAQDATNSGDTVQNYLSIRDAYFDLALESKKEHRLRFGISKVPYGFENLQSSGNRPALDRTDGMNSGTPSERDTGIFYYYAPSAMRKMFKDLTSNNLKGTGDYGMFAIGAYNGQGANRSEQNEDLHRVIRLTYPWKTSGGQFFEASLQAMEGQFDTDTSSAKNNIYDQRSGASFIVYPQPIGFQAEWNVGMGPEYDPQDDKIESKPLSGGYFQVNYQVIQEKQRFHPYVRWQTYSGGRKGDDSASVHTEEIEVGTEWQPHTAVEFTVAWATGNRSRQSTATDKQHEDGSLVRLQAQFNY